jgi:hypothetical protein
VPVLIALSILSPSVGRALFFAVRPREVEEIKPVLAYVRDHRRAGDSLYVFYLSQAPLRYYHDRFGLGEDRFGLSQMQWVVGESPQHDQSKPYTDLARLKGKGRVWVLITHPRALGGIDEWQLYPAILVKWGRQLDQHIETDAGVFLYEMGRTD